MRGDRPQAQSIHLAIWMATPHARGSTLVTITIVSPVPGYPACAGIDLRENNGVIRDMWLPRMRGDRPVLFRQVIGAFAATPHARGSTR